MRIVHLACTGCLARPTVLSSRRRVRPRQRCGASGVHARCDAALFQCHPRRGQGHRLHESEVFAAQPGLPGRHAGRAFKQAPPRALSSLSSLTPLRLISGAADCGEYRQAVGVFEKTLN